MIEGPQQFITVSRYSVNRGGGEKSIDSLFLLY
jgi:hypothetical protein